MLFNSLVFLFAFLPLSMALVYALPSKFRNPLILIVSLIFYAWGNVSHSIILIISIIGNYIAGLQLGNGNDQRRKTALTIGIVFNLGLLVFFKYINFLIENINELILLMGVPPMEWKSVKLPIGISFFTFQAVSYLIDVYRRHTVPQKSLLRLGLFISLFPQLVAGPIVRYNTIEKQLGKRKIGAEQLTSGIKRFVLGLAKKIILADTFAYTADQVFAMPPGSLGFSDAWLGILLYSLQIYYDFSGYSDMAIGLGKMMGFDFPENFNFPYIARSIREFWRRWHITLSSWFKDYLYIPLGGSRVSSHKVYRNLIIVFFLTGLWHGASWNFVLWGLFHGLFMVLERSGFQRWLDRVSPFFNHLYVLLVVMLAWVLFRAANFDEAMHYYSALFSFNPEDRGWTHTAYLLNRQLVVCLLFGLLGAFPFFVKTGSLLKRLVGQKLGENTAIVMKSYTELFLCMVAFFLAVLFLISSTHQPFIYFQF